MAFLPIARVLETGSGSGTGNVTLLGAQGSGEYDAFNERLSVNDSTFYIIVDGAAFEIGYGTYSAATPNNGTFTRDTVIRSSSGTSKISLSGSNFNIFSDIPSEKSLVVGPAGNVTNVSAVAGAVIPKNFAAMKALAEPSDNTVVGCGYGSTEGDGLGGLFRWDDASTATADDLDVLELDDVGSSPGRWIRERQSLFLREAGSDPSNTDEILRRSDTIDIKSNRSDTGIKIIPEVQNVLAHGRYETLAGLKAVASSNWKQGDRVFLLGISAEGDIPSVVGTWQASSTNTDALDVTFIRPDDISGSNPGRFQFPADINVAESTLTIAEAGGLGAVTVTRAAHVIAAESSTADDLDTVTTTGFPVGATIRIRPDTGDTITIKNGTGNITTDTGGDIILDAVTDYCTLTVTAGGVVAYLLSSGIILDEDDFATDSATLAPSQQSVGAYVAALSNPVRSIPASDVGGSADAITLTVTGGPALADGLTLSFLPGSTNTGAVTIDYNGGGALTLVDGADAALLAGALTATGPVVVRYTSSGTKWQLLGGASVLDEDDFATDSATRPPSQQAAKAYIDAKTLWPNAKTYQLAAYDPTVTRVAVDTGSSLYRHVPSIAVKSSSQILAAYLYNASSDTESQTGQVITFRRSADDGATWSSAVAELNSTTYATAALDPSGDSAFQGESHVAYNSLNDEEIAVCAHRGGSFEAMFAAFRDASAADPSSDKWTIHRLRWNSSSNAISPSTSDITAGADSGFKLTKTIEGAEYDAIPLKPIIKDDGSVIFPIQYITTFTASHRIGFVFYDGATWTEGGIIPIGDLADGDAWEPTVWRLPDGTWRCQVRDLGGTLPNHHAVAESTDLKAWSGFKHIAEDIHDSRMMKIRVSDDLYLGSGISDDSLRNHMALYASGDGVNWVHGLPISAETDATENVHYSDIAVSDGKVYVIYSQEASAGASLAPNEIRFARLPSLPTAGTMPVMPSDKNIYELGSGTAPTFSGQTLTVPPQMIASVTPIGRCYLLTIKARISVAANSNAYHLVSVGDASAGYFVVSAQDDGGTSKLYANGVEVADLPANEDIYIQIAVDTTRQKVAAFGQELDIGRYARIYIGDTDTDTGGAQAGNIVVDCAESVLAVVSPDAATRIFETISANANSVTGDLVVSGDITANGGDIKAVSAAGQAALESDGAASSVANLRFRLNGTEKSTLFYSEIGTPTFAIRVDSQVDAASRDVFRCTMGGSTDTYVWGDATSTALSHDFKGDVNFSDDVVASGFLGFGSPTELTIDAAGEVTATQSFHSIDTESDAASDELATINGGSEGDILVLKTAVSTRDVVLKHATGNIFLDGGTDKTLDTVSDRIMLQKSGSQWFMISFSGN